MLQPGITLNVDAEYNRCIVPSLEVKGPRREGTHQQLERETKEAAERAKAYKMENHTHKTAAKRDRQEAEHANTLKRPRMEIQHEERRHSPPKGKCIRDENTHTQEAPAAVGALQQLQAPLTPSAPETSGVHEKLTPETPEVH